jgi:phenylalanyl-tRNA synthetase beta chain
MKIPLSWLKDYVDITLSPEALAERLTLAGLEVDAITRIGDFWEPDKLFVGQILEVLRHPDAERLVLARVSYGADGPMTVVTGAPNLYPYGGQDLSDGGGPKVVFAVTGARLYDGHSEERRLVRLKASKIRGISSEGMVCSEKELGLSDEHEGVILLPPDAPVGMPLTDYLGDTVFELDIKGAFGHLQCVVGIAREAAALTGEPLNREVLTVLDRQPAEISPDAEFTAIVIEDPDLCGRYSAALIEGVTIGPSPLWMQRRLQRAGMRPINNVVDITNYVMLEVGQPLHAFDYDRLRGRADGGRPTIIMRRAHPGEPMQTLDGVDRLLDPEMLMITDTAGPIAVGGVMGGAETEINEGTTNILLEAANFDFLSIRRTGQMLKLSSEAASRFGKQVDPELTVKALARAGQLLKELAGGVVRPQYGDVYPGKRETTVIQFAPGYINAVLGSAIATAEMVRILRDLEFEVAEAGGGLLRVTAPSHRLDVRIPADLAEEIGRIYGYDRLTPTLLEDALPPQRRNLALEGEEKIRDILTGCGLSEVITYSIVDLAAEARLERRVADALPPHVKVLNPLSAERDHLRRLLLPELLNTARANLRFNERVAIFELGRAFQPRPQETLPAEPRRLAAVMVGPREPRSWLGSDPTPASFFDLKGVVEALLDRLGIAGLTWERGEHPGLHPGRTARVMIGGADAGLLGELHPAVRSAFDLPEIPIAVMELDVEALLAAWGAAQMMAEISGQPAIYEDVAVVVDEGTPAAQVAALIRQIGGKLLTDVRLFDIYRGGQVPAGKKSLAYALSFQASDRTLTDEETAKLRSKIVARLERELGATLRS